IRGHPFPAGVDPTPEPELTREATDAATAFVQLLAPPAPLPRTVVEQRGGFVFLGLGCASCHVPVLVTGPNRVSALSLKIVQPYSDLLLHDLGPDLADICLARARPAEFRTEPLLGLRFQSAYLHARRGGSTHDGIPCDQGPAAPGALDASAAAVPNVQGSYHGTGVATVSTSTGQHKSLTCKGTLNIGTQADNSFSGTFVVPPAGDCDEDSGTLAG